MWHSDNWKDYTLLDCSNGERLERWGAFKLIRPDPTVIFNSPRNDAKWSKFDARYVRSQSGGGRWEVANPRLFNPWRVYYKELAFLIKLMNFKHTGIFPEQAANWDWLANVIKHLKTQQTTVNVLNMFAYTGGATLACLAAGAKVTHVDAAKGMVEHARQNADISGLRDKPVRWLIDDCREFIKREIRRGNRYDALIMDPPSYGRGTKGEVWKLEDDLYSFCMLCSDVLVDNPKFILLNSYTTGLSPSVITYLIDIVYTSRFGGRAESRELGIRCENNGLYLPAGASCRWTSLPKI